MGLDKGVTPQGLASMPLSSIQQGGRRRLAVLGQQTERLDREKGSAR